MLKPKILGIFFFFTVHVLVYSYESFEASFGSFPTKYFEKTSSNDATTWNSDINCYFNDEDILYEEFPALNFTRFYISDVCDDHGCGGADYQCAAFTSKLTYEYGYFGYEIQYSPQILGTSIHLSLFNPGPPMDASWSVIGGKNANYLIYDINENSVSITSGDFQFPFDSRNNFHEYGVIINDSFAEWFIDGISYYKYEGPDIPSRGFEFYMSIQAAIGNSISWYGDFVYSYNDYYVDIRRIRYVKNAYEYPIPIYHQTNGSRNNNDDISFPVELLYIVIPLSIILFCIFYIIAFIIISIICCIIVKKNKKNSEHNEIILSKNTNSRDSFGHEVFTRFNINKSLFSIDYKDIKLEKQIGEGGGGAVIFQGLWEGRKIAFKYFKTQNLLSTQEDINEFENELAVMSSVSHPSICTWYGAVFTTKRFGIVMEFCSNGDLVNYFSKKNYEKGKKFWVKIEKKIEMLKQIAAGMGYLHSKNIMHRDLKCRNVMLDESLNCKLIDFGLSRTIEERSNLTKRIGTSITMAPEVVKGHDYSFKADVFSFSIVIYCLINENFNPYGKNRNSSVEYKVANDPFFRPEINEEITKRMPNWLLKLMKNNWSDDANNRNSFQEILCVLNTNC